MWRRSRRRERRRDYGLIFDFDGTLALMSIDFAKMRRKIDALFSRHGISPERLHHRYVLERIDEAMENLKGTVPDRAQRLHREAFDLLERIELAAAAKSHLLPGVYPRLWRLRREGFRLAIATRNCQKVLDKVLGSAKGFFDIILTRENSLAYKPEQAALRPILQHFALPVSRLCMIGDHPLDILTARRLSITPIAVMTGTGTRKDLLEAGTPFLFKHVNQAIDFLLPNPSAPGSHPRKGPIDRKKIIYYITPQ